MKRFLFLLLGVTLILSACSGSDPADESSYDPAVHTLQSVILDGAQTLALKERENRQQTLRSTQGITERCDELGKFEGVNYSKLETTGQGGSIIPCFKNIQFWDSQTIYGQYKYQAKPISEPTGDYIPYVPYVWFITDPTGNVHHLPNAPKKGRGFKNEKLIRQYQGKPVYFNSQGFLAALNLETDREEIVINTRIDLKPTVIFTKDNGDHIVYKDQAGGKIRRPDGSVESIWKIDDSWIYYKNPSNDLTYGRGGYLKNMILDATGNITRTGLTVTPVFIETYNANPTIGEPAPPQSISAYGMSQQGCDKINNLIICGTRTLILADTSQDVKEINWTDYETNIGIAGSCVTQNFIYTAGSDKITRINLDLSAFEHVLTNFQPYTLKCLDDNNLIIHGFNTANNEYETFQLLNNVRTMITENISAFIRR